MSNYVEIDTYVLQDNEYNYQVYQEELNQTLRELLDGDGWKLPQITTTRVNELLAQSLIPVSAQWYNTTDNVMQIMTNTGVRSITTVAWP